MSKEIKDLMQEIRDGEEWRRKCAHSEQWAQWRKYYTGEVALGIETRSGLPQDILYINALHGYIATVIARTYFRVPRIMLRPRKAEAETRRRLTETQLNWLIQEMELKQTTYRIMLDALLYGTGIVKIGYDSEFGFAPDDIGVEIETEEGDLATVADATLAQRDSQLRRIEYKTYVRPGMPWVLRLHPRDFVVPVGTIDHRDVPWVAHRYWRLLRDVKADTRLSHTGDLTPTVTEYPEAEGDEVIVRSRRDREEELRERAKGYVELFEVRDYRTGRMLILAEGAEKALYEAPDTLAIDGPPFEVLVFNRNPESFWGVSDVQLIYPQILEMNEARTQAMKHRRITLLKFFCQEGLIEDAEINKMLSEAVGPVIKTKGPPGSVVTMLQPHIPPDLVSWPDVIRGDMREVVGLSRNQAGEYQGSSRTTATEASIVERGSEIRLSAGRDMVTTMLVRTMRRVYQVITKLWTTDRVARIVGPEDAVEWRTFTGEDLVGEFDFQMDAEEASPLTGRMRMEETLALWQQLGGAALIVNPQARQAAEALGVNVHALLAQVIRVFDTVDSSAVLGPAPPPQIPGQAPQMEMSQGGPGAPAGLVPAGGYGEQGGASPV